MIQYRRIVSDIEIIENIAVSDSIRNLRRLRRTYGGRRWRKIKGSAQVELLNGEIRLAELHWYEAHGIGKREIKDQKVVRLMMRFAICIDNDGYEASLELRKVYQVVAPEKNDPKDYIRVIDESGEDYLYYKKSFEVLELPQRTERKVLATLR